jgi:hypothetical protein
MHDIHRCILRILLFWADVRLPRTVADALQFVFLLTDLCGLRAVQAIAVRGVSSSPPAAASCIIQSPTEAENLNVKYANS